MRTMHEGIASSQLCVVSRLWFLPQDKQPDGRFFPVQETACGSRWVCPSAAGARPVWRPTSLAAGRPCGPQGMHATAGPERRCGGH